MDSMDSSFQHKFQNIPNLNSKISYNIFLNKIYKMIYKISYIVFVSFKLCPELFVNIRFRKIPTTIPKTIYNIVSKHNYKHCFKFCFELFYVSRHALVSETSRP